MKMYRLISYREDGKHVYFTKAKSKSEALDRFKERLIPELQLTEVPFDCKDIIAVNYIYC